MNRSGPVVDFSVRPSDPGLRAILSQMEAVLGKLTSFADVTLLSLVTGHTVTNAASGAGTAITATRTAIPLADSGADQVRVVVHGANSGVGSVIVQVWDVSRNVLLCTATVTDAAADTFVGEWTSWPATGEDQEVEVRVVGDGAFDPVLYSVHLQLRTLSARK